MSEDLIFTSETEALQHLADKTGKQIIISSERERTAYLELSDKDKGVVNAFLDKKEADSKKLTTNGKRLDGNWMGGLGIAEWKGEKIDMPDLGSKSAENVQKYIQKEAPQNWLKSSERTAASGKYPELDSIAKKIADDTARNINEATKGVKSEMPYKTQYVLEEAIKILEGMV